MHADHKLLFAGILSTFLSLCNINLILIEQHEFFLFFRVRFFLRKYDLSTFKREDIYVHVGDFRLLTIIM